MTEVINIMRHESVFNPSEYPYPIHIVGAGATGSRVFTALIELGITNIKVYDPDDIEDHNLANQIYVADDIGAPKVMGCKKFAQRKLGIDILPREMEFLKLSVTPELITSGGLKNGIVFILTDTMASRQSIFDSLARRGINPNRNLRNMAPMLIIETRMASTHGSVYTVNPFDQAAREAWKKTLVDDSDTDSIELSPCGTTLSVGTTASLIANYAVWQMMQFFVDPKGLNAQIDLFFKPTLTVTSSAIAA